MFTGIITTTSDIVRSEQEPDGLRIVFARPKGWDDLELGESVATNGVCLTVTALRDDEYECVLVPETLARSSFGQKLPDKVNLERSLRAADRFSGHFVQGHVDETGAVKSVVKDEDGGVRLEVHFSPDSRPLVILKGSVTVDGVALTISKLEGDEFEVSLIPHTLEQTTLDSLQPGDKVNLEFDVIGKYVINSINQKEDNAERPAINQ